MSDANVSNDSGTATDQRHPVIPEDATIILPVRNMLLFPGVVLPLTISRPSLIAAAQEAVRSGRKVGLLLQKSCATLLMRIPIMLSVAVCGGSVSWNSSPAFHISLRALRTSVSPKC